MLCTDSSPRIVVDRSHVQRPQPRVAGDAFAIGEERAHVVAVIADGGRLQPALLQQVFGIAVKQRAGRSRRLA
jgi:hypothetical protein